MRRGTSVVVSNTLFFGFGHEFLTCIFQYFKLYQLDAAQPDVPLHTFCREYSIGSGALTAYEPSVLPLDRPCHSSIHAPLSDHHFRYRHCYYCCRRRRRFDHPMKGGLLVKGPHLAFHAHPANFEVTPRHATTAES